MTDYGFTRVSTGSQDAQTQERDIREVSPNAIIVTPDTKAASASKGEQTDALDEVIAKLVPGDRIIVTDSSRLDRRENLDDQVATLLAIRNTGAVIQSLAPGEENFGKGENLGNWITTIVKASANAEKSRTVKVGTWRGIRAIIENKASYGPLPIFWEAKGGEYKKIATCIDPDGVRDVYQSIRNGQSLSSVARRYHTYPQSIRKLIRLRANKTAIFDCRYTYEGTTYTWKHDTGTDPVIDLELFSAANRVMGERGAVMNNTGGRPVSLATSWISGILDCPRCGGHLYVLRGKSLRCGGKGKYRHSCGISGIDLLNVTHQINQLISGEDQMVYRYQRVSGNQGELDELTSELSRVRATLATTDDNDEFDRLSASRKVLLSTIENFVLVPETHAMTETGETLAELWFHADSAQRRDLLRSLHSRLGFRVDASGYLDTDESTMAGGTLVELTDDICVKMNVPPRDARDPWTSDTGATA